MKLAILVLATAACGRPAPIHNTTAATPDTAPPLVFRRYYTGAAPVPSIVTYTLRTHGDRAELAIEKLGPVYARVDHPVEPGSVPVTGWRLDSSRHYAGTTTAGRTPELALTEVDGTGKLTLHCRPLGIMVASEVAVRKPHEPPRPSCSGEQGQFVPPATTPLEVTYCYSTEPADGPPGDSEWNGYDSDQVHAAFAPAPGVEWLWVDDDCAMQGGGFRRIPADGSIRDAR